MTKVLAVLDPLDTHHLALERCREMPPDIDLDIHAVAFVEHDTAKEFAKTYAEKKRWLEKTVTPFIADGYKITSEIVPFGKLYESIIETATTHACEVVIKPMRHHSLFETLVRTTTDWNLIRECPYPLLLVSENGSIMGKPVVAALDVCSGDEKHDELNSIVMREARLISRVINGDLVLANAWRSITPMAAVGSLDSTPMPQARDIIARHKRAVEEIAFDHGLGIGAVHVEEGAPAVVVNDVARSVNAGLVVVGTVARTGISGRLIGNSAEGVLEGSQCDVMVVKLPAEET